MTPEKIGEFSLIRRIALGGTAEVFQARNKSGDDCAIKLILPHIASSQDFVNMFLDETNIVKRLLHTHIVKFFTQGFFEGRIYIALEWIDGVSLANAQKPSDAPPYFALFGLCEAVLSALDFAHNAKDENRKPLNIVHRDICPHNILVNRKGIVKVSDFGIAKAKQRIAFTRTGEIKGRLDYMPPEQARGGELDGRADIYSLGKTALQFIGKDAPSEFRELLETFCAPDPNCRPESARKALDCLHKIAPHPSYETGIEELANWVSHIEPNILPHRQHTPILGEIELKR
ncbi:MAG: hypothetical protein Kow0090_20870 [Myxococcota bacterium]